MYLWLYYFLCLICVSLSFYYLIFVILAFDICFEIPFRFIFLGTSFTFPDSWLVRFLLLTISRQFGLPSFSSPTFGVSQIFGGTFYLILLTLALSLLLLFLSVNLRLNWLALPSNMCFVSSNRCSSIITPLSTLFSLFPSFLNFSYTLFPLNSFLNLSFLLNVPLMVRLNGWST